MTDSTPIAFSFKSAAPKRKAVFAVQEKHEEQENRDFIASVSENQLQSVHQRVEQGPLVIPLTKTEWNDTIAKKPRIEQPANMDADKSTQPKERSLEQEAVDAILQDAATVGDSNVPLLLRSLPPGIQAIKNEEDRFKYDVSLRPDQSDLEDYDRVPIEQFGMALLRGMGWNPSTTPVVSAKEVMPRADRLGLGAMPPPPELSGKKEKKYIKPGETREKPTSWDKPKDNSERERERERSSRDRDRERDRDRNRDRDRDRERTREGDRSRERERDRVRNVS